jgi:hypothetical protein
MRVVMRISPEDRHRKPEQSIKFLEAAGIEVRVIG